MPLLVVYFFIFNFRHKCQTFKGTAAADACWPLPSNFSPTFPSKICCCCCCCCVPFGRPQPMAAGEFVATSLGERERWMEGKSSTASTLLIPPAAPFKQEAGGFSKEGAILVALWPPPVVVSLERMGKPPLPLEALSADERRGVAEWSTTTFG